jgi:hypothetical protein
MEAWHIINNMHKISAPTYLFVNTHALYDKDQSVNDVQET